MLEAVVPVSNRAEVRRNLDRLDLPLKSCEFFGFSCKPFSDETLIIDGRALTEWPRPSLHEWRHESARILRYELTSDDLQKVGMFVTLQIFCKHMLSAMLQEVTDRLNTHWMTGLISEYSGKHPDIWTEYTLYDLYGERSGLREKHHIGQDELPRRRLHCMEQSI